MEIVMCNSAAQIRPLGFNAKNSVDIENIDWCIDDTLMKNAEVFLILQGASSKLTEIVRLAATRPYDKNHTVFKLISEQKLRLDNETVYAKLLIIKKGSSVMTPTNSLAFVIQTKNYELSRHVALTQDISLVVEAYYKAILEMYNELKKGVNIDDNES